MSSAPTPDQLERLGAALLEDVPAGWTSLTYSYRAASSVARDRLVVTLADGSERLIPGSLDLCDVLDELREQMYDAQRGPWYTATATLTDDLSLSIDFDYDHEPEWSGGLPPIVYVEDVQRFPRPVSAYPEWLVARLAEAGNAPAGESSADN